MTGGSVRRQIVRFALPIFWGNLFQQLYNIVDSLVVGNFLGSDALAAVGSSGNIIFLLVGLFGGLFTGASVVISGYFGAQDHERMHTAIHTTVAFGLLAGVILSVVGVVISPTLLRWIGTPESVFPNSVLYFRIYFSGVVFVTLYNTATGILQAVGDSRHPLYYLIISSITNVVLDLLFVAVFHMGVDGAALATVISQADPFQQRLPGRAEKSPPERPHAGKGAAHGRPGGPSEFHYFHRQYFCPVRRKPVRCDGYGRRGRILQDRRLRLYSHHGLCAGADHLRQPESGRGGV